MKPTEKVVLSDPRLAGWVQTTGLSVFPGEQVRIVELRELTSGELFDSSKSLTVWVEIVGADGEAEQLPLPIFFRRADDKRLDSFERFADALEGVLGTRDFEGWWAERDHEHGLVEPPLIEFAFHLSAGLQRALAEIHDHDPELAARVMNLCGNAYLVGRSVATWELKEKFEAAAQAGLTLPDQRRAAGKARGAQMSATADAWQEQCISWANQMLAQIPPKKQPRSFSKLATAVLDSWAERPFKEKPEPPDHAYLTRYVFPEAEKSGRLFRPTVAQPHRPAPASRPL
jgi:hypothetical protein